MINTAFVCNKLVVHECLYPLGAFILITFVAYNLGFQTAFRVIYADDKRNAVLIRGLETPFFNLFLSVLIVGIETCF